MNNGITPILGMADFVPVIIFFIGLMIFRKEIKSLIKKQNNILLFASSVIILLSAGIKATHKVIIGINGTDVELMYRTFWVGLAVGYLLLFFTLISIERGFRNKSTPNTPVALATMPGKMIFMLTQMVGLLGTYIMMVRWSAKLKNKSATICFAISLILIPVQMYLGQIFDDTSGMHWIGQTVNGISTTMFSIGILVLKKDGLKDKIAECFEKKKS